MTQQSGPSFPAPVSARTIGLLALSLAVAFTVILPLLRPVLPVDETRYLSVAWEMYRDVNFIVPHLNGEIYGHKPPLLFWLINLIWSITGPSEVAARLVAPAFGVLSVALTWRLGNRLFADRPGLGATAALILASTGVFALYGSLTMFDTMLTSATLLGILALLRMDAGGRWPATLGLGAALAFGVLAKGPVILVHLLPLALAQPFWTQAGERQSIGAWYRRLGASILMALAILAVWLVPALWLGGPDYRDEILWRQSAGRMVNAFDHARPIWFFVAILPVLLWPWAWRPSALRGLWTSGLWQDRRARFLAVWGLATLVLFSLISGKQAHYLIPALPAAALALAAAPMPRRGVGPFVACLAVVVPVLIWAALLASGQAKIDGVAVMTLGPATFALAVGIAVAGLVLIALAGRRAPIMGWALVAPVALLVTHLMLRPAVFEHYDTARFAAALSQAPAGSVAIVGYPYQGEFGFTARLPGPITLVPEAEVAAWVAAHPGGLLISASDQPDTAPPIAEGWLAGRHLRLHRVP
ncbi:MAG: glycosyltransferase family 39 protein [Tabrizicola sp.]|uniref:ArnT family glycosyltransferase n=1 Tax=Tabrizicola sp. TaxID=2005166 RepID=UPI0027369625|nr:glycosyltransferase family 39 protein [Tabrizicola sp.]MDP3261333.1 glycosyltransferase family 39 protein [Tabrizicola sp.]MDP3647339.1 glycosyltransferase family 39 protein [Paracoccaceae bacterium]MDZ4067630.1 glycosyltransferase family 39 protein [Tabrizicola sp.]